MKRKHYPLVTGVLAALLTATPLLLLTALFAYQGDTDTSEISDVELLSNTNDSARPVASEPAVVTPAAPRLASNASSTPVQLPAQSYSAPTPVPQIAPVPVEPTSETTPTAVTEAVPLPADAASETVAVADAGVAVPLEMVHEIPVAASNNSEMLDAPSRVAVDESYYQATGHLALVSQPQVMDNGAGASMPPAGDKDEVDPALLEEVIIQTPVEKVYVAQVENLVANTKAKGWPIALVKSDIPDDVWWVQQVVGIQGNSFAARVNFGNHNSISGSTYTMVIVFLDSADEVRRFRIAKQFKDIPEGIRRSREFNYVRR